MDAVTYPDPEVDAALQADFVGFKLCLTERHKDFKEAACGAAVPWAPTFLFTDGKGREVRRSVGWLAPQDFLAELRLARAQFHLTRGRFDEALAGLEEISSDYRGTQAAPEAGYYAGVALFLKGKRDMTALKERWTKLRDQHPKSDWASKASVADDWNG